MASKLFLGLVVAGVATYVASCSIIGNSRDKAFDSINIGDTRAQVIQKFAAPYFSEPESQKYLRYTGLKCQSPCAARLWFENRMSLDMEAWSIEFNASGNVIKKSRLQSP